MSGPGGTVTVFDFSDFREFLKWRVQQQTHAPSGRKRSSLRRVATGLGYQSPSLLSMVLTGKRMPSDELCEAMLRSWDLPLREREYFRLMVERQKRLERGEDDYELIEEMRKVSGKRDVHVYSEAQFSILREWYYLPIRQLVDSPGFKEDPAWISRALRRKVTPPQARTAIARLLEAGILVRDPATGKLRNIIAGTETPAPAPAKSRTEPSSARREHHRQMGARALEALDEQTVDQRFFAALTLKVKPERLPQLREQLMEFLRSIDVEFAVDEAYSVHQLNLQFFEHTAARDGRSSEGK